MNKPIKEKILSKIYRNGRGWVFSANDFFNITNDRNLIDVTLFNLLKSKKILKAITGLYYYPLYSKFLNKELDGIGTNKVAEALARKFSWRIIPEGNTALNYLGLSTQVVAKYVYLSDGPTRTYKINKQQLFFIHTKLVDIACNHTNSKLVVQAFRALDKTNITKEFLYEITKKYTKKQWQQIKKDTKNVAFWIYKYISDIADGKYE